MNYPPRTSVKKSPVKVTIPHPVAWQVALSLTEGKTSRLFTLPDRSVIVANSSNRPKWAR